MIHWYNSIIAYSETDVTNFGQLLSGSKQNEFCVITI